MKRWGSAFTCAAVVVGASLAAIGPGEAGDGDHGRRHHGDRHGGHGGHGHRHGGHGHWDHGRGHGDHRNNFSLFFDFAAPPPRAYGRSAYGPGRCQPMVQQGWWYGRPAEIGSTLCYDAWGNNYVVDGSAYVIRYLDGRPW